MNLLNERMPPCAIVFRIVIAIGIFGLLLGALTYFDTYYSKGFVGMYLKNLHFQNNETLSLVFIEKSNY